MKKRVCLDCGTEHPLVTGIRRCPECGGLFDLYVCPTCGGIVKRDDIYVYKTSMDTRCMECHTKRALKWRKNNPERSAEKEARWKATHRKRLRKEGRALIEQIIARDTKPLTEDEWLATCKYFRGCALCGGERIETRYLFVHPKDGGRYTMYNVIPLCGRCSTKTPRSALNMYFWTHPTLGHGHRVNVSHKRRNKLLSFVSTGLEGPNGES